MTGKIAWAVRETRKMGSSPGGLRNQPPQHQLKLRRVLVCLFRRYPGSQRQRFHGLAGRAQNLRPKGENKGWGPRKLLVLLLGVFLLFQNPARAQTREVRRVLILNVMGPLSSPGVAAMDEMNDRGSKVWSDRINRCGAGVNTPGTRGRKLA